MSRKQGGGADADSALAALMTNAEAVRAITSAVEGTIGPKGLDTMLVDRFGEVIITNDGVTILEKMDINHPAAKMLIHAARAQKDEVGDGTTTATIMAGALVAEGLTQVLRGVPVARVIEGIRFGIDEAARQLKTRAITIDDVQAECLFDVARIAGRAYADIAQLVVEAARLIGRGKLKEAHFKLSDTVLAQEGAENEVFLGVIIEKERLNQDMPLSMDDAKVMVLDDALAPEELGEEALGTEAGFKRYLELQEEFRQNIAKLVEMDIQVVLTDRAVDSAAEEAFTDAGMFVVSQVNATDLRRVAEHTGARMMKRTALKKEKAELQRYLGKVQRVYAEEKLGHIRMLGGDGKPMATILVGAATAEVVGERERIAKDAASSVQAAVKSGYLPGGGAAEIAVARELERHRDRMKGMAAYGLDCVTAALKRPLAQIVDNAGFNPLEKVEEVLTAQASQSQEVLGIDCESGAVADMLQAGIMDPLEVKLHALKAAGEVAVAILRIDTIIRKRDENGAPQQGMEEGLPDF